MESDQCIMFALYVFISVLLAGMGIPLLMGWVPPNSVYGFRTAKTLADTAVWYPVNRTAGVWMVLTGVITAGVSTWTYFSKLGIPIAPLINLLPVGIGIIAMIIHGSLVAHRMSTRRKGETD